METQDIVTVIAILLASFPQFAAFIGTPKMVKGISVANGIFQLLAGNHSKAENKDE